MVNKRIGIVTPLALESLFLEFHHSYLANVTYLQANAHKLPFNLTDVRMIAPNTFPIDANRNECIAWIKKWDCDITVWFDADQDLMNDATDRSPDTLFKLLSDGYNYPVYAGIYYLKKPPFHPIIFEADKKFRTFSPIWRYPEEDLFYADMIGMGCCKIDRSVIDALDPPFFKYNVMPKELAGKGDMARFKYENNVGDVSEDVAFWRQVKKKTGERIVVDPKIQVGHVTKATITKGVFEGHMAGNKQIALDQLGEEKYNQWWSQVCQAEILKKEN